MKLSTVSKIVNQTKRVYDITTENNHNFFCDGFLIHNCDYRGEILVALINLGDKPVQLPVIKDGKETAIAQIIFESHKIVTDGFTVVDDLTATQRGAGGFGSSDTPRETVDQASKQMKSIEQLYEQLSSKPQQPAKRYVDAVREREQKLA